MDPLTLGEAALLGGIVMCLLMCGYSASDDTKTGRALEISFGIGMTTFASLALGGWLLLALLFGLGITERVKYETRKES